MDTGEGGGGGGGEGVRTPPLEPLMNLISPHASRTYKNVIVITEIISIYYL